MVDKIIFGLSQINHNFFTLKHFILSLPDSIFIAVTYPLTSRLFLIFLFFFLRRIAKPISEQLTLALLAVGGSTYANYFYQFFSCMSHALR